MTSQDYKATRELVFPVWQDLHDVVRDLAARVEALEEAENDRRFETAKALIDKPASAPAESLVDRVALAISRCEDSSCWDDEAVNWSPEARAAILEVAAWMRENDTGYNAVRWLEMEADNSRSQEGCDG